MIIMREITFDLVTRNFLKRDKYAHKGSFGTLACICGSYQMHGAAVMAASAALKCGVGKVNVFLPKSIYKIVGSFLCEPIFTCLYETNTGTLSKSCIDKLMQNLKNSTACVFGCGSSNNIDIKEILLSILKNYDKPLLIDADGINAISDNINVLKAAKSKIILTPHPGEMSKLLKVGIEFLDNNREEISKNFAREYNVTLVLKGANTLVATPYGEIFKNTTGNPGMARAGMGDALSGMIGSFLAQGMTPLNSALCGVYLHGLAGDICAEKFSEISMSTMDLINELPYIFLNMKS